MYDDDQQREHNTLHSIIQSFTQGLRALPTDSIARVRNFLTEYLGDRGHPVPFGGRSDDFTRLHNWLVDPQAAPYLLLAAPAGRGKSALLLRWCQQLLEQQEIALAYFPVSIRFRTNLAGVVFPALTALLTTLHGEQLPKDPNLSEEVWRGLLTDYLTRPLPDGRQLLLVLDGIDEAADWTANTQLFPLNPPPGLRIVLSARSLANDPGPEAWLERLGWTQQRLAQTLELSPLDRTGIASVLLQMGFPLELLSTRIDIVAELYRLSEGDPLLVRLYVDDLWKRGEAVAHLQADDLHTIHPGLAGYFERWWREQRQLWSDEAQPREAAVQLILSLLAGALGPLKKEDIQDLTPDEVGFNTTAEIEQHMAPLARFVTGDGTHQGYVFSHPRLGNYFLEERLSNEERLTVEQRFLAWGNETLTALNTQRLAPEQASPYIVQYYGVHLEHALATTKTFLALVSNGWRQAWEKLDRAQAGYLGDVERAWRAAEHADRKYIEAAGTVDAQSEQATVRAIPYLGAEIRCLLNQVSINSMASNISPRLMFEAVKTGIWTPAQGLACLRLLPDLAPRAQELVALAPLVREPVRTDILHEAVDTVSTLKDEYARQDALVALAPGLSEELLWQLLERLPEIEDEADRAGMLSELAPSLAAYPSLLAKAIEGVQAMEEEEFRALSLQGLAPYFTEQLQPYVLQLTREIEDERDRAQILTALVPHLPIEAVSDILPLAHAIQDGLAQLRLLTELVLYLPDQLKSETLNAILLLVQELEDRDYRVEILVKLAAFLPEAGIQQTLQEIQMLWDERGRAAVLLTLLPYVPNELLPQLLTNVLALKSEEERTKILIQLLPRLSAEALEHVLECARTTWDEGYRAHLLAQLALVMPKRMLAAFMEITKSIEDPGYLAWLLAEIEAPLKIKLYDATFSMDTVFQYMPDIHERTQTLLAIVPRLSDEALARLCEFLLPGIFGFTWRTHDEEQRAHILTKLGARLPETWLVVALEHTEGLFNDVYKAQVLVAMAPQIRESLLSKTLDIVRNMKEREQRARVLEALVASSSEERRAARIQEMLQILQLIKDEKERISLIAQSITDQTEPPSQKYVRLLFDATSLIQDYANKELLLIPLAPHLSTEMVAETLVGVLKITDREKAINILEALAPYFTERQAARVIEIVRGMQGKYARVQLQTAIFPHLSATMLIAQIKAAQAARSEDEMAEILNIIIPHLPAAALPEAWQAILQVPHEGRRAMLLAQLALRTPESQFPQLWKAIVHIDDMHGQIWVFKTLVPQASEALFVQLWEAVQKMKDQQKRGSLLHILIQHVPENYFHAAWEELQKITKMQSPSYERGRLVVASPYLEVLAPKVSREAFPKFFRAVQAIHSEGKRVQILIALLPRTPEGYLAQMLEEAYFLRDPRKQIQLLHALLPYYPQHTTTVAWEIAQNMPRTILREQIIQGLLPYLSQEQISTVIEDMFAPSYEGPPTEPSTEIIKTLIDSLSSEQCLYVLDKIQATQQVDPQDPNKKQEQWSKHKYIHALALLVPRLLQTKREEIIPGLLENIASLKPEDYQAQILADLAQVANSLPEEQLDTFITVLWTLENNREPVLQALDAVLTADRWTYMLRRTQAKIRASEDPAIAVQVLKTMQKLTQQSSQEQLYPLLSETLHLLARQTRRETLNNLISLLPVLRILGGKQAIQETSSATLEVGSWWP
ncbi:hypothetical protein ccbrp13_08940 [Ktedonobacteria bacterium brp13]|nr:hypothetical protein ccbrp13_08940 [Ktedonobacteria bacterium brp13]